MMTLGAVAFLALAALVGVLILGLLRLGTSNPGRGTSAFERAPVALFQVDGEGRLATWNEACERALAGDSGASLEGLDLAALLLDDGVRTRWQRWVAGDASPVQLRTRIRTLDGREQDTALSLGPGPGDGGAPTGALAPADTALRTGRGVEREASLFREILAAAPVGIATFDREGRVDDVWNPAAEAILGWSASEIRGEPIALLPAGATGLGSVDGDGTQAEEEAVRRWRRDGRAVDLSIATAPVAGTAGQRVAILQDVTERVQRDLERRRLDEAIRATPDLVLMADVEGKVLYQNAAARKRFAPLRNAGEDGAGDIALWASGVLGPEWEQRWRQDVIPLVSTGESWAAEVPVGEPPFPASIVVVGHRSRDGRLGYLSLLARDMTEQRSVEEQLRQSQKLEAVGQLSGGIAHDFNNLLTVVQANVELLHDRPHDPEDVVRLKDIEAAARRGRDLVRRLMVFSRKETLSVRPYKLCELEDYIRTLRRLLPETVVVQWTCADPDLTISADPGAIEQILLNLSTNARDAMPDGGRLLIEARATPGEEGDAEGRVELVVRDTGTGMSPEVMARVFEPFYTTKPPGSGTGLGLAMAYALMRQLDGEIRIESEVGKGTAFHLVFQPLQPGEVEEESAAPRQQAVAGSGELILVVEDEKAIRTVFERSLERLGYRVLLAADGQEGLEQFEARNGEIDLVISDVVMPRLGGPALLARVRASGSRVPFMFVSGYTETEMRAETQADDSVVLLSKPWTRDELREAVAAALDSARATAGEGA